MEQDTPIRLDDMLCFAVYSTGLAFNRVYKPLLDRLGLTYPQYIAILALAQKDDQSIGELGEQLFLESNTLTPLVKRLEAAGFVARRRDAADERVVRVSLTDRGRALLTGLQCVPDEITQAAGITLEQFHAMHQGLTALRANLRTRE
ncbi:MarR family winged helix-turn-helix transcriptional regulator [Sphingobium ummariense]